MGSLARPRVLLLGDPSARPTGLERALTRAGFQLVEREDPSVNPASDAVLITVNDITVSPLSDLLPPSGINSDSVPPSIVLTSATDREAAARALSLGASDALVAPIHLPELCARLHARIRDRVNGGKPAGRNGREASHTTVPDESDESLRALDHRMREEFERARRYSLSFSLILLGVDELIGVRDRLGPEAAERLKQEVAEVLRRELRVPDFVVAYGASDFAIVLPETGQAGARQSVIRVRERLAVVPSEADPRLDHPRFSAGIVTYPHPSVSQSDELYAMAEAALMRGKGQAGERIGVAM